MGWNTLCSLEMCICIALEYFHCVNWHLPSSDCWWRCWSSSACHFTNWFFPLSLNLTSNRKMKIYAQKLKWKLIEIANICFEWQIKETHKFITESQLEYLANFWSDIYQLLYCTEMWNDDEVLLCDGWISQLDFDFRTHTLSNNRSINVMQTHDARS